MWKLVYVVAVLAVLFVVFRDRAELISERLLANRELTQKHLPNCVPLKKLDFGSEDITILDNGRAFISTGLKFPGLPVTEEKGKIFTIDLKDPRMKPMELRMSRSFDLESFNPHGISVFTDQKNGEIYLLVVNHPQHQSQVEMFLFMEDSLSLLHLKTFKHELLHSVNDIVAVAPDAFYATNDHYFSNNFMKTFVEVFLAQPWTNVVYYSPKEVKVVSEGYFMANGINISPDKKSVYVVDLLDHNVHVLDRKKDNSLVPVKNVSVGSLCDNVEVDPETGDLWMGCHPNGMKLFMSDPDDPAGSEVIRIQNIHSDQPVVTQVYSDNGKVIIGSSTAAVYGGKLLIGSVYHKALCCELQ